MRPFFLAWLTVALLLLVLGKFTGAGDELAIAGFLNATDQEAAEGYFAVGGDTMVVVKQGSGVQRWLKSHAGQRVRVTLTADVE
jgi:fructose-1,6-bisphosphatase